MILNISPTSLGDETLPTKRCCAGFFETVNGTNVTLADFICAAPAMLASELTI
jgi:hypothetical protein